MAIDLVHKLAVAATALFADMRRIVLFVLLTIAAGCAAIFSLPSMEDPPLSQRAVSVVTLFPGADAEQVESQVTEKIEKRLLEVPELKRLRSQSRSGVSWISFEVKDSIGDPELVWTAVREKVDKSIPELPLGVAKPVVKETTVAAFGWIGALVWQENSDVDWDRLRDQALDLKVQLSSIPGTKSVDLFAEPEIEISVVVDPAKIASLGSSVAEVAKLLKETDAHTGVGTVRGNKLDFYVRPGSRFDELEDVVDAPIFSDRSGAMLRLKELAKVSQEMRTPAASLAFVDGKPAIIIGARLDPNASIQRWTPMVDEVCKKYVAGLPSGTELQHLMVQHNYVSNRLADLVSNLVMGFIAVSLVTLVMMGWRSAVIVSISLPLSALMVLAGMHLLEIPFHQISITGLIIALGLLIDNAIIAVDETCSSFRHEKTGISPIESAIRKLIAPLTGSTLTTVVAFAPIAMMDGPTGEFLWSLGATLMLAVCSSLFLSITLLPILVGRFNQGFSTPLSPEVFWWKTCLHEGLQTPTLKSSYKNLLHRLLERPAIGMALVLIWPLLGLLLFPFIPEQFFPAADRNQFQVELELVASASIDNTVDVTRKVERLLKQHPQIKRVHWTIGESAPSYYYNLIQWRTNTPSFASAIVEIDDSTVDLEWIAALQLELQQEITEARVTAMPFMQGPPMSAPVEVRVYGRDLEKLREYGEDIRRRLEVISGVVNTRADVSEMRPTVSLDIDRLRARAAGLDEQSIANQVFANLEGLNGGSLAIQNDEIPIRVRIGDSFRSDADQLGELVVAVRSPTGGSKHSTPLSALAKTNLIPQPCCVTHMNGERCIEIQAFLDPNVLPATVVKSLCNDLADQSLNLAEAYRLEFGGDAAERELALQSLLTTAPLVAILMVVVLVLTLRSFRQTMLIALVGLLGVGFAMAALWLFGFPFGLTAIIGTLGLIGIVINDSIVILCVLSEDARQGKVDHHSMVASIVGATRHVLSTSLTTVIGFAPLVLTGGSFWPPLAIVISAGVLGATVVSLTFVPCAFELLYRSSFAQSRQNLPHPSPQTKLASEVAITGYELDTSNGQTATVRIFPPIESLAVSTTSVGTSSIR